MMEKEDVPVQDIQDFKKAIILMKSVDIVRANAAKEKEKRRSPSRYKDVKSKVGAQATNKDFNFSLAPSRLFGMS